MGYEPITRTAPGWEERTVTLLPAAERTEDGAGPAVPLRPGFARLAVLLDLTQGMSGAHLHVQHSPDGTRWYDLAAFSFYEGPGTQVAWLEAQPALSGSVARLTDGGMMTGTSHAGFIMPRLRARWSLNGVPHTFGVDVVAIYERAD